MAISRIDIEAFMALDFRLPVIDVRSEGEYAHAHIPGAVSMPLFNNEERKLIGTTYKQESRQKAIKLGLHAFGKKMVRIVEAAEKLFENSPATDQKTVVVHCWRGGMRSEAVAWLLDLYGFKVYTIIGGYKAFRRWVIQQFEQDYPVKMLGGYTGSGKTYVLDELKKNKQVVIDLEELANHKGSAFGSIGMPAQPSQEMFENLLAVELKKAEDQCNNAHDNDEPVIWVEDESQRIGLVNVPMPFFNMYRSKPIVFLDIPFEERLKHIVNDYGKGSRETLINAINRIQKRLGGLETKTAINHLMEDNLEESFRILLKYYDKQYLKGLHNRINLEELLNKVSCNTVDAAKNAATVLAYQKERTTHV